MVADRSWSGTPRYHGALARRFTAIAFDEKLNVYEPANLLGDLLCAVANLLNQ